MRIIDKPWKNIKEMSPRTGILLQVFRMKNKKYMHAEFCLSKEEHDDRPFWATQHGNAHRCEEGDVWQEMQHYCSPGKFYKSRFDK